ncbi:glycoside hydrolase family 63, partial [Thecamonas trahens ATCC 50062]
MDSEGWIAREQILGPEAESRVPEEFMTQFRVYANPPTLLLPLASMQARLHAALDEAAASGLPASGDAELHDSLAFLRHAYPLVARQFEWFKSTQAGSLPHTFKWQGRTTNHTLTSGLDDYPRAPIVSPFEKHVDLASWMVLAARLLADMARVLDDEAAATSYEAQATSILTTLHNVHWNEAAGYYCDTGPDGTGSVHDEMQVCFLGYVSLFPLLTGLLEADDPRVGRLLDHMADPDTLWSPGGIRSLSATDPYYGTGENYWKGPVWMNINYMALAALANKYAVDEGPHRARAQQIYASLRANVVDTIVSNYIETGYFWEQYSPTNGVGQRTHPFAGWTTLVVLIMAEEYPPM